MASKTEKSKLISRFLRAPVRFLTRARDFYVQSLTDCSGHLAGTLPRSFSSSSSSYESAQDEDFCELVRAASTKSLSSSTKRHETYVLPNDNNTKLRHLQGRSPKPMPRSFSVGMGRIDEEKPADFKEGIEVRTDSTYIRSRSCANKRLVRLF